MTMLKIVEECKSQSTPIAVDVAARTTYHELGKRFTVECLVDENHRSKSQSLPIDAFYRIVSGGECVYVYKNQSAYLINGDGKTIQVIHNAAR